MMICRYTAVLLVLALLLIGAGGEAAAPPRMRPYVGVGVVIFPAGENGQPVQELQLPLYEEPGLARVGMLTSSRLPGSEWIFAPSASAPLVVSARKGTWLRVIYDDAGREAWLEPGQGGRFQAWEQYLKMQTGHLLAGVQPVFYQLVKQPGGKLLATLTPKQVFKVLKLEGSWIMVLTDQSLIGWLRWCDDDGRLLVGLNR
jgi:hypothetical protein